MSGEDGDQERLSFVGNSVPIDGQDFTGRDVYKNKFTYSGGPLPIINETNFYDNHIEFVGPALNGVQFFCWLSRNSSIDVKERMLKAWGILTEKERIISEDDGSASDGDE